MNVAEFIDKWRRVDMARNKRSKIEKALVGPAGEYFVLYQLHLKGLMASLAPRNAPTVDILVLDPNETVRASVQVKARTSGRDRGWIFGARHEQVEGESLVYALVDFAVEPPRTYLIPSTVVADALRKSHRAWLDTPGRGGRGHKDNSMRRIAHDYKFQVPGYEKGWMDEYLENWELLSGSS